MIFNSSLQPSSNDFQSLYCFYKFLPRNTGTLDHNNIEMEYYIFETNGF